MLWLGDLMECQGLGILQGAKARGSDRVTRLGDLMGCQDLGIQWVPRLEDLTGCQGTGI